MAKKAGRKEADVVVMTPKGFLIIEAKAPDKPYSEKDIDMISSTYLFSIQKAVEEIGISHNQLSKLTRIPQSTLSRFLRGDASMRFEAVVILLDRLGLEIRPKGNKAARKKTKSEQR